MPLMISADGKGWVKAPAKKRKGVPISRADQAAVLKSPLSYFACQPSMPSKPKIPLCPVYTLDPNEHTPPSSEQGSSPTKSKRGTRSASTPHQHHRHPYDDEYPPSDYEPEEEAIYHTSRSTGGAVRPPQARSTISYDRVRPRANAAASPPPAPRPAPAPKPRAVTAAPVPASGGYTYWTGPSNKARVPPRSAAWGGGSSTSSSSGASARWANATAPLAL